LEGAKIMAEAKLDELKEEKGDGEELIKTGNKKEDNEKELKDRMDEKSKQNVGYKKEDYNRKNNNEYYQKLENGGIIRYKKGRGIPKNAKKAKDSFRDYKNLKKGIGANSIAGIIGATFIQVSTADLSNLEILKRLFKDFNSHTKGNNYPYNIMSTEELRKKGADLINIGLDNLIKELTIEPNLNSEMGSMNESLRMNAYNSQNNNTYGRGKRNYERNLINPQNYPKYSVDTLMNKLEKINRNNPDRIVSYYNEPEILEENIHTAIERYNEIKRENRTDNIVIEEKLEENDN